MLKAIIIDDEPNAVSLLVLRLTQHCPQVEVAAACTDSHEGIAAIRQYRPDLVFLDIEMPQLNGFEVLHAVRDLFFALVFVTAYDRFAIKAFKYSAIDYLLKPLDTQELIVSVGKAERQRASQRQLEHLRQQFSDVAKPAPSKVALPYQNGVTFVEISAILYCEADDNYTRFHLLDGHNYIASKTLRDIQELLEDRGFLRIHRQYLINIDQIRKFVRGEGSYVVMSNGCNLPVSRGQKDRLIQRFGWL